MEMNLIDAGVVILVTIAIINRVKSQTELASWWYTIMAFVIGAIVYLIGYYAPPMANTILFIGLAASGIYDAYKKQ